MFTAATPSAPRAADDQSPRLQSIWRSVGALAGLILIVGNALAAFLAWGRGGPSTLQGMHVDDSDMSQKLFSKSSKGLEPLFHSLTVDPYKHTPADIT